MGTSDPKSRVLPINDDELIEKKLEDGIGLCLSGGGYRAMLFHVGTLWRLNELGYLPKLSRISSVSGGSITSATLGMNWNRLEFDQTGVALKFNEMLVSPIRKIANETISYRAGIKGLFDIRSTINEKVEKEYEKFLFGTAKLSSLPDADTGSPRFVINATNVQSGMLWRFSKPYMGDYRVGLIYKPDVTLAKAVAASSAFPPFLSPAKLKLDPKIFTRKSGNDLVKPPFTSDVVLSDGGVYDNLGLETVFKKFKTVLVSDGGAKIKAEEKPRINWLSHGKRVADIVDNQVRSLRKRALIAAYINEERSGAYWGIRTDIAKYKLSNALNCPHDKTMQLAKTPTQLQKLDDATQKKIINWGYAVCDAAMRKHVDPNLKAPTNFPYPNEGVG